MSHALTRSYGLRFTVRQQMILVSSLAILFALCSHFQKTSGSEPSVNLMSWAIVLEPWLFGMLLLLFDRPGPAKNWMVLCVFTLFSPAIAIAHDSIVIAQWTKSGNVSSPAVTFLFNVFFFGAFGAFWRSMGPATCPACGRWSLIPLVNLWGQTKRTEKTRWCATCGGLYWRKGRGEWLIERRSTWLDRGSRTELPAPVGLTAPAGGPGTQGAPAFVDDRRSS
jgi:hypothetical protein